MGSQCHITKTLQVWVFRFLLSIKDYETFNTVLSQTEPHISRNQSFIVFVLFYGINVANNPIPFMLYSAFLNKKICHSVKGLAV